MRRAIRFDIGRNLGYLAEGMRPLSLVLLFFSAAVGVPAQQVPPSNVTPLLLPGLGHPNHPIATKNAEAQKYFDQGLQLVFGFNRAEAVRSLARFRDIRFVFSHAGGTIPMLAGRIAESGRLSGVAEKLPNGVEYELKRLHYEVANSANRSAMSALMNLVPTSQIMFGSDYPFVPIGVTANGMTNLGLSPADLQGIGRDNAVALLPRLKLQGQSSSRSWSGLGREAVSERAS